MRKLNFFAFLATICSPFLSSADTHQLGGGVSAHTNQKSGIGYHVNYQWQFSNFIEFSSYYIGHNVIEATTHSNRYTSEVNRLMFGLNLRKFFNQNLTFKAGTGLSSIIKSDNEHLIKKNSIAPYILLAANYSINENIALEFGQQSYFDDDKLDKNHNVYLSILWKFGSRTPSLKNRITESTNTIIDNKSKKIITTTSDTSIAKSELSQAQMPTNNWYIQFGAFAQKMLANSAAKHITTTVPKLEITIKVVDGYHKILSSGYQSKATAQEQLDVLKSRHKLNGFIVNINQHNN